MKICCLLFLFILYIDCNQEISQQKHFNGIKQNKQSSKIIRKLNNYKKDFIENRQHENLIDNTIHLNESEFRFNKKFNHQSETKKEETDAILDRDLHDFMKTLAGQNGFDFFAYTEMAGDTIGFNMQYDADAKIQYKNDITMDPSHISAFRFKENEQQNFDESFLDIESVSYLKGHPTLPEVPAKTKMTEPPNEWVEEILNDTIEVAMGLMMRTGAVNRVLSVYPHLAYTAPLWFFLDASLLVKEFQTVDNGDNNISTLFIQFNYRKKIGNILHKRHMQMKISCNMPLLAKLWFMKNPVIQDQISVYQKFFGQMYASGSYIAMSNQKMTKKQMHKAVDFGPQICKVPKDDIRLLDVGTYVQPFVASSFLSLACLGIGSTEDRFQNQDFQIPEKQIIRLRRSFGLSTLACKMPDNINPSEFQQCAIEGAECFCSGTMSFAQMKQKWSFNPCVHQNSEACLSGSAAFPCTIETVKKFKPGFDDAPPKIGGNTCYCLDMKKQKMRWMGIREKEIKIVKQEQEKNEKKPENLPKSPTKNAKFVNVKAIVRKFLSKMRV